MRLEQESSEAVMAGYVEADKRTKRKDISSFFVKKKEKAETRCYGRKSRFRTGSCRDGSG